MKQILTLNGKKYLIHYNEWTTWNGKKASGYSCQVDNDALLSGSTLDELKEEIKNHKPINNDGTAEWYGQGRYMGD